MRKKVFPLLCPLALLTEVRRYDIVFVIMSKERSWKFSEVASLVHDSTIHIAWLLSLQIMIAKFPVIAF